MTTRTMVRVALGLAITAGLAAIGEAWRYILLLVSRNTELSEATVSLSDALVVTAGVLSLATSVLALVCAVMWIIRARQAAAKKLGGPLARSVRQVLLCLLVPVFNVVMAGVVLAELEHVAAGKPGQARPRPSLLLGLWWGLWALGEVLVIATIATGFFSSVQAMANGVELHFFADVAAAAVAVVGLLLVRNITRLLEPLDPTELPRSRVVAVSGAPEPPLRVTKMWGSIR